MICYADFGRQLTMSKEQILQWFIRCSCCLKTMNTTICHDYSAKCYLITYQKQLSHSVFKPLSPALNQPTEHFNSETLQQELTAI